MASLHSRWTICWYILPLIVTFLQSTAGHLLHHVARCVLLKIRGIHWVPPQSLPSQRQEGLSCNPDQASWYRCTCSILWHHMCSSCEWCCHFDQRAGAGPLARVMGWGGVGVGSCTVLRLGQEGVDKQDQGNAQQGALASYTDPTGTGMLSSVYTILSASWDSLFTYMVELFIFILFLPLFSPIKLE